MCDNQEETTSSKFCTDDGKLDDIAQRCQPLKEHYKKTLPKEVYKYFEDKLYYLQMLWRKCPEKLMYPAIDEWEKAIQDKIDPLGVFLLGWHTGRYLKQLENQVETSIRGRMHRSGARTDSEKSNVDPRLRKIYEEFESSKEKTANKKMTLNRLLQQEFKIKNINKPNAELGRYRSMYYRAAKILKREQYHEDLPKDYHEFFTAYLDFFVRFHCISDFEPTEDIIFRRRRKEASRTIYENFIHEKAVMDLMMKSIIKKMQIRDKKYKHSTGKTSKAKESESDL